jgi:hypothetical protein
LGNIYFVTAANEYPYIGVANESPQRAKDMLAFLWRAFIEPIDEDDGSIKAG